MNGKSSVTRSALKGLPYSQPSKASAYRIAFPRFFPSYYVQISSAGTADAFMARARSLALISGEAAETPVSAHNPARTPPRPSVSIGRFEEGV